MQLKTAKTFPLLILFVLIGATVRAQESTTQAQPQSAQELADSLRLKLEETKDQQNSLQERLKVLEEELKPQNIENSYAGVGSTHPEDLREARRRQLEKEKAGIQAQLRVLSQSQVSLERRILEAEAKAYHQSAGANSDLPNQASSTDQPVPSSATQTKKTRPRRSKTVKQRNRRAHD